MVVLAGVNGVATKLGLRPLMRLADARGVVPGVMTVPAEPDKDAEALQQLARFADVYSPLVSVERRPEGLPDTGDGGLWLNITGCAHLFGGEAGLCRRIQDDFHKQGYEVRCGLADTAGAAWAVARFTDAEVDETIILSNDQRQALQPLPVAALRLDPETVQILGRLGLKTIGDLYDLPRANLTARLGGVVLRRLDQALGRWPDYLSYLPPRRRYLVRQHFAEPLQDTLALGAVVSLLLEKLCRQLVADGLGLRRLWLTVRRVDGRPITLEVGTSMPLVQPRALMRLCQDRLTDIEAGFGIDGVLAWAQQTETLPAQQQSLTAQTDAPAEDPAGFAVLVDRLRQRLGQDALAAWQIKESHLPERLPKPADPLRGRFHLPKPVLPPRPLRLFSPAEPVQVEQGEQQRPARLRWRRQLLEISETSGPERLTPEWWRRLHLNRMGEEEVPPTLPAGTRDYYRIADDKGRRLWLCRVAGDQPDDARWTVHGLFE